MKSEVTVKEEIRVKVDYGYMINVRLLEISRYRSNMGNYYVQDVLKYLENVNSLISLIIFDWRKEVKEIAFRLYEMIGILSALSTTVENEKRKKLANMFNESLRELPEDFQDEFSKYSRFTSDICFIVTKLIDKLFEKIVDHLRNEGILLRTKEVALGAPK